MAYQALLHFARLLQGICIVDVELQESGDTSTFVQRTARRVGTMAAYSS